MSELKTCPNCGRAFSTLSPGGLCPQCLLRAGLAEPASDPRFDPTQASPAHSGGVSAPGIQELAARFPQLEIIELLGKGGMGAVYKARQRELDRVVALKILPPEISRDPAFVERFMREARALARLSHPNIVAVYDFGRNDGLCYFIMEYVDGVNLRQAIKSGGMSPKEALAVVPQICDALQFAHDEGIVHRDIKPENILIDKRGRIKIADFGLAKLLDASPTEHLTATQQVMGTLRYMAPEQMEGAREVDHRADIYSLGVVFYELLTGELPIGRFAPPSKKVQLDVRLDEVVLRALEREPELRFQHASEVKTEVEAICGIHPQLAARMFGREWRSQAEILGLPLVHVAFGIDPRTGKKRVAKGIVAIGDMAIGVLSVGGVAFGGLCFGGVGIGLMSFSGLAIGLWMAIGGCAIGLYALGGFALGAVAIGGGAVGYYGVGGGGAAVHGIFGNHQDPLAQQFFQGKVAWPQWLVLLTALIPPLYALVGGLVYALQREAGRSTGSRSSLTVSRDNAKPTAATHKRLWFATLLALSNLLLAMLLLLITAAPDTTKWPDDIHPFWIQWSIVDNILGFVMAAALFAASIGLLLWQEWGRKATLAASVAGLASLVIDMPYLTRAVIPAMYAEIRSDLALEGYAGAELDSVAGLVTAALFGGALLFGLVLLVGQLIYFTRPHVVAALRERE